MHARIGAEERTQINCRSIAVGRSTVSMSEFALFVAKVYGIYEIDLASNE